MKITKIIAFKSLKLYQQNMGFDYAHTQMTPDPADMQKYEISSSEDELPFACYLCREVFKIPIVTRYVDIIASLELETINFYASNLVLLSLYSATSLKNFCIFDILTYFVKYLLSHTYQ